MKKIILYLVITLPLISTAQNFEWLRIVGDIDNDFGQWAETDSFGNIYVAGFGRGTCNFDNHTIASINPFWFVAKYDSDGNNIWATEIPIDNGYLIEMRDFKINSKGDCYVVGDINTNGSLYGLLVKVDSDGNLLKQITPLNTVNITSIGIDANNNYYIGGISSTGMFIRRYTANDIAEWTVYYNSSQDVYSNLSLRLTSNEGVYVSFLFKNTIDITDHFNNTISVNATNGILDEDRVIIKYDASGALAWAKNYNTKMPGRSMAVDTATDVIFILVYDKGETDDDYLIHLDANGTVISTQDIGTRAFIMGWEPHLRIHNDNLYYIGGGLCLGVGGHSMGFFRLKRYDMNGILNGQLEQPFPMLPPLGDIAFHEDYLYLVGGTDTGTWGNQTLTMNGNEYSDFFIAKLSETNLSFVSGVSNISLAAFQTYPNPVISNLTIQTESDNGVIYIHDITGRQIVLTDVKQKLTVLDVANYSSGIYFITYTSGASSSTVKIVKQ